MNVRQFDGIVVGELLLIRRREFECVFVRFGSRRPTAMAEACCKRICEEHALRGWSGLYRRRWRWWLERLILTGKHGSVSWKPWYRTDRNTLACLYQIWSHYAQAREAIRDRRDEGDAGGWKSDVHRRLRQTRDAQNHEAMSSRRRGCALLKVQARAARGTSERSLFRSPFLCFIAVLLVVQQRQIDIVIL